MPTSRASRSSTSGDFWKRERRFLSAFAKRWPRLDIVIPVYNEGGNIVATLRGLSREVKTPARVLICYDREDDDTLPAIAHNPGADEDSLSSSCAIPRARAHAAVMAGFAASKRRCVVVYPADDDYNAGILDRMVARRAGLRHRLRQPLHAGRQHAGLPLAEGRAGADAQHFTLHTSRGYRRAMRAAVSDVLAPRDRRITVESDQGFSYSIELLVKAHRLGWRIGEVPARWFEREHGTSRFRVLSWLPAYLRWYGYAFATTFLRRPPKASAQGASEHDGSYPLTTMAENQIPPRQQISPWMKVIAREVEFTPGEPTNLSRGRPARLSRHSRAHAGRPNSVVRQYRPALEAFTWELPAGLVEKGEDPAGPLPASSWRRPGIRRVVHSGRRRPAPGGSATASIPISCKPKTASITSRLNPVLALNWRPHLNSSR